MLVNAGREELSRLCGFANWRGLRAKFDSEDDVLNFALDRLQDADGLDEQWIALGQRKHAVELLLWRKPARRGGYEAGNAVNSEAMAENIFARPEGDEREDMMAPIFRAVHKREPVVTTY